MKIITKYLFMKKTILLMLLFPALLFSQTNFQFTVLNDPYQDLVGSTSLNNGQTWDDPGYFIPLGFDFEISTHIFNSIYIVNWSVGGTLSTSPNFSGIVPFFYPIGQDIIDLGYGTGSSLSNISYLTEGNAGNRILKIEWNNVGFFDDSTESDFMNFQMWLYEGSNIIEYRYGPSQINNPNESFEGETGPSVGIISSYDIDIDDLADNAFLLSDNPANPNVIVLEPGDTPVNEALLGMIPDGTVYRFTPQNLSVGDFENLDFKIYPNPVSHSLNIHTNTPDYEIEIYNSVGQKINKFSEVNGIVDVSALSSGIYFIRILTASASATQKFVKQ